MKTPLTKAAAVAVAVVAAGPAQAEIRNILLVHGMNMDGSVWRAIDSQLSNAGYTVGVVQMPMTSVAEDVAAVRRSMAAQNGPMIVVAHSYGGLVITEAATDGDVRGLVYVAAFQPEAGESLASLSAEVPAAMPSDGLRVSDDGFFTVRPDVWTSDVAQGLPAAEAGFTARSQAWVSLSAFEHKVERVAWRDLPVWSIVATQDRVVAPELQRRMSARSGAEVTEVPGGHLLPLSHPEDVVRVIEAAAQSASE